jgi:DNA-directed RNA polymerase subunit RPC12/RpoP
MTSKLDILEQIEDLIQQLKGSEITAGSAGSGRFPKATGNVEADELSRNAEMSSRYARRDNTLEAHTKAGDLHFAAGKEHSAAGNEKRANEHFRKASGHYKVAKALSGCNAARGSEPGFSDKNSLEQEHRRNLSESGGAVIPDADNEVECPYCSEKIDATEAVTGGNDALTTCPHCTGSFKVGTPVGKQDKQYVCPNCDNVFFDSENVSTNAEKVCPNCKQPFRPE